MDKAHPKGPTPAAGDALGVGGCNARAILERLASRRSCRDFDGSAIDRATLAEIVADGIEAPSSCNQQNWHFIVVTDGERRRRAMEIAGGNPHFANAAALVYLTFQKGFTHGNFSIVQSVAAACYHMMLSAHLRGFDTVWNAGIGDHDALRDLLKLPAIFEPQGALAIGRAAAGAPAGKAPRRPAADVVSFETFDRPAASIFPVKPADAYPFFAIANDENPFAEWDPRRWRWDQLADFRGHSVWAKSPLAGVYVSRRQGDALAAELDLLPATPPRVAVEIMPWGGTSTVPLARRLPAGCELRVAELSAHNARFIAERLTREGLGGRASVDLMDGPRLPYGDGAIDLVVVPQSLEHMPEPEAVLDEIARVLALGGQLVLSARNLESLYGDVWRRHESRAQVPVQGPFTPLAARTLRDLVAARFAIEEESGIGREAAGDAARLTGDDALSGRLYALRARRT